MFKHHWILLFSFLLVFVSCKQKSETKIPDVSNIKVDTRITRFEDKMMADTNFTGQEMQQLLESDSAFASVYFAHVYPEAGNLSLNNDTELKAREIESWIRHPRTQWLYDTIKTIYPDLKEVEGSLNHAFQYAKYYMPDEPTPKLYTTISDFGYFPYVYAEDSIRDGIGISLEMFLGSDFPYMDFTGNNNAFSSYLTPRYNKDFITKRVLEVWINDISGKPSGDDLLHKMIDNGKKLYILQKCLPASPDSVIMDWSQQKLNWVNANERDVWYFFTTGDLLYETSMRKIQKYIQPAPWSPGMPEESPGNTASWLGWKIVSAYMDKHPDLSFKDLLSMTDAQKIMKESGYKPPR